MFYSQLYLDFEKSAAFLAAVCCKITSNALSMCVALGLWLAKSSGIATGKTS